MQQLSERQRQRRVDVFEAVLYEQSFQLMVSGGVSVADHMAGKASLRVRAERAEFLSRRLISAASRRAVLDGSDCVYCGDPATSIDHIVPVQQRGTNELDNFAPACRRCNEEKLDWTPEQWQSWRQENGWPWPPPSRAALFASFVKESA